MDMIVIIKYSSRDSYKKVWFYASEPGIMLLNVYENRP